MNAMIKSWLLPVLMLLLPGGLAAEQLSLNQISNYLNGLTTARADFRQINDDGSVSTGQLYISRPGKMRFEYDPPNDALVIAENLAVMIIDRKSNTPPETYPLNRTPLSLILGRNINLAQDRMVVDHGFDGEMTVVTAQDPRNPEQGTIRMRFSDAPMALQDWTIVNEAGGRTQVVLSSLQTGMDLPRSLFDAERELPRSNR
jgi:outer membrane lipoprotein-sorting protein